MVTRLNHLFIGVDCDCILNIERLHLFDVSNCFIDLFVYLTISNNDNNI